jgi:hypothetical protein
MKIEVGEYLIACGAKPLPKKYQLDGWRQQVITEKQKELLGKNGIAYSRIKYKGQASIVIDILLERKQAGLCSPKQIKVLLDNGYGPDDLQHMSIKTASRIIGMCYVQ